MKSYQSTISFIILISLQLGNYLFAQQATEQKKHSTRESVVTEIY